MRTLSLRSRLSIRAALLCGIVLGAFGVGVSWHLSQEILGSVRDDLHDEAEAFFQTVQRHHSIIDWQDVRNIRRELQEDPMFHPFEVCDLSGLSLFRSIGMAKMSLLGVPLTPGYHSWQDQKGRNYIVGTFLQNGLLLRIVGDMDNVNEIGFDLMSSFLVAGPVMLLLGAAGSWFLLRRAFWPVDQIVSTARRITAQRLNERLPEPVTDDEIGRLTRVLNQMIDRLETSFQQASRFTADASHELKTPLTILRNDLELRIEEKKGDPAEQRILNGFLEEISHLSSITEKLLLLSQADAGRLPLQLEAIDLGQMLGGLVEDIEVVASGNDITVSANVSPAITLHGDRELLQRFFLNLLDNAVKYNRLGGRVDILLQSGGGQIEFRIANTGQGIPAEQAGQIFQRFHRGNQRGGVEGYGLGLSLCREIALAHGGSIALSENQRDRTEFRILLPVGMGSNGPATAVTRLSCAAGLKN